MVMGYRKTVFGLAIAAFSMVTASAAMAQDAITPVTRPVSIPEQLNQAFFANDRDFYQNRSIPRQISFIAGPGILIRNSFPDNEIARDGKAVNQVLKEIIAQQTAGTVVRTPDLVNPFNASVRNLPVAEQPSGVVLTPPVEVAPAAPLPAQNQQRVPALW